MVDMSNATNATKKPSKSQVAMLARLADGRQVTDRDITVTERGVILSLVQSGVVKMTRIDVYRNAYALAK